MQNSDNQWDDSIGCPQLYHSSPADATRFFSGKPHSEWDGPAARKLRDENHALRVQLAELARVHEERVSELEAQLADANMARVAAEQRLQTLPTFQVPPPAVKQANQSRLPAGSASQEPQRWAGGYQPKRCSPPMPTLQQRYSTPPLSLQPHEVFYKHNMQQQTNQHTQHKQQSQRLPQQVHPAGLLTQPDVLVPEETGRATKVLAYCSDFISASLHSSATPSAFKVAPSWKLFGRPHPDDMDEEMGRAIRR